MTDGRHPYTHAADFVRALGPVSTGGVVLSRSDASQIISGIAQAIGMTKEDLATKLSLAEQLKTEADRSREAERIISAISLR